MSLADFRALVVSVGHKRSVGESLPYGGWTQVQPPIWSLDRVRWFRQSERVVASLLERPSDVVSSSALRSPRVVWFAMAVVLVSAVVVWWFAGGTSIRRPQGNLVGVAVQSGEEASFGFALSADGSDAQLRSVNARVTPDATVEWSVYQGTGGTGFGTWHGPLAPTWPVVPVDGARVSEDETRATWVIATVRSTTPGVYRVSNITATYQSGWRTRDEDSGFVGCLLVAPADRSTDELRASDDPLWQEYEACSTAATVPS